METMDVERGASGRRWIWILVGVVGLVAGAPILFLLFYGGAVTLHEWSAPVISLPPFHIRVMDSVTGAGIPGARVMRGFFREGAAKGFDSSSSMAVAGSLAEATTDAEGNAVLPGTEAVRRHGIRGLTGVSWVVFRPGWMPASGCYSEGPMREGGCSGFGGMGFSDPWFRPKVDRYQDEIDLDVRLIALPAPGAPSVRFDNSGQITTKPLLYVGADGRAVEQDAWSEYFRELNLLVQRHYLNVNEFIGEAAAYAEKRPLTEGMLLDIGSLVPSGPCDTPYCRDPRIRRLARALVEYCDQTPVSEYCRPRRGEMIQRLREWLEEDGSHE